MLYSPDNQTFNCIQRAHQSTYDNQFLSLFIYCVCGVDVVSDIAIFVLKRDVKLQLTNCGVDVYYWLSYLADFI